ncbi:MAG TPA: iron uptake porin [Coleofasciculaceae cyanobacterium]
MSRIFWNALKVSPALLGASFLVASSTYAAQSVPQPTDAIATNQVVTPAESVVEPEAQLSESPIADTSASELAETPSTLNLTLPQSAQVAQVPVGEGTTPNSTILEQINQYDSEGYVESQDQVTNVSQLRDVSPGDWAYEALRSLVERYGCIAGYPDGTYRGNRAMSRYEFAAGLNACLNQIERLIGGGDVVTREEFETLQRLVQEFQAELTTLGTRVDNLEGRVAFLEDHQFSTTTKLNGEVIFALADIFGGEDNVQGDRDFEDNTVFFDRVRLNLDTSFTGKDRLRTRLQAGNYNEFDIQGSGGLTREGRLGFTAGGDNDVTLDKLWYRFPVSDFATAHIFANAGNFDDFVPLLNPAMESSGTGSISRFGRYSPIYRMGGQNAGVGLSLGAKSPIRIDVGYLAGNANNPGQDGGIFEGSYSALGQLTFQPSSKFSVAATYVNGYVTNPSGNGGELGHGTGSLASNLSTGRPVVSNSLGLGASFAFSPKLILSGWGSYTEATVIGRGQADIWQWAGTLALLDVGSEGSVLGFVVGMEPKLTDVDGPIGLNEDNDTGLHLEGFYKFQLTENISVTPGLIWLTSPGHNSDNDDTFVGTVRTTFTF